MFSCQRSNLATCAASRKLFPVKAFKYRCVDSRFSCSFAAKQSVSAPSPQRAVDLAPGDACHFTRGQPVPVRRHAILGCILRLGLRVRAEQLQRGLCGSGLVAALPAVLALVFDASLQVPGEFLFSSKIRCGRVSQAVTVLQNLRGMKKGSRFRLPELSRAVVLELELQGQRHGARVAREDRFGIQEVRSRWIQVRTSGCTRRIAE